MGEYDDIEHVNLDISFQKEVKKELGDELRNFFPHGHPAFIELTLRELDLHSRKNHDYAGGGSPLGNFQRVTQILSLYPNLKLSDPPTVAIVYLLKQLDATLNMLSQGYEGQVEGHTERWQDISVYSKIISILVEESQKK
jgi:hypothetical protein